MLIDSEENELLRVDSELIQYTENFIYFLATCLSEAKNQLLDESHFNEIKGLFPYLICRTNFVYIIPVGLDTSNALDNYAILSNYCTCKCLPSLEDFFNDSVVVPDIYQDYTARMFFKRNNLVIQFHNKRTKDHVLFTIR